MREIWETVTLLFLGLILLGLGFILGAEVLGAKALRHLLGGCP